MTIQTKKSLSALGGLALAEIICLSAFVVELRRALDGNTLSWAYVFEWPMLGAYAVYMWHKLRSDVSGQTDAANADASDDPALNAFNAYLAQVHDGHVPNPTDRSPPHRPER